jgi:hypothetical protein
MLALCWIGSVLLFFSLSTTQEYYSMPCYPAFAILLGSVMAGSGRSLTFGTRAAAAVVSAACAAVIFILFKTWGLPTPGDISAALNQHPDLYTLSLGHMLDLTWSAFAYLRLPLVTAGVAFVIGAAGACFWRPPRAYFALAVMMVTFVQAAHLALAVFDPYMSSQKLAEAFKRALPGTLIVDDQYYTFSSIFFYTDRSALLLNGRKTNLEYGSYAPHAPDVFITDAELPALWASRGRYFLVAEGLERSRLERLLGRDALIVVNESGGKYLFTNLPE